MCGICGCVGDGQAAPVLRETLRVMERHRLGFESAGNAAIHEGRIKLSKDHGSVDEVFPLGGDWLDSLLGSVGVGHVRYPSPIMNRLIGGSRFAHPFLSCDGRIVLVHNGTVNDYREIWSELGGHEFSSFDKERNNINDSEVIVYLLEEHLVESKGDVTEAVRKTCRRLSRKYLNQFLFAFLYIAQPSRIYVVSRREYAGKRKVVVAHKEGLGLVFASYRDLGIDGRWPLRIEAIEPFVNIEEDDVRILPYDTLAVLTSDGYDVSVLL